MGLGGMRSSSHILSFNRKKKFVLSLVGPALLSIKAGGDRQSWSVDAESMMKLGSALEMRKFCGDEWKILDKFHKEHIALEAINSVISGDVQTHMNALNEADRVARASLESAATENVVGLSDEAYQDLDAKLDSVGLKQLRLKASLSHRFCWCAYIYISMG